MNTLKENLAHLVWFFDYDGSLCPHYELWEDKHYNAQEIYDAVKKISQKSVGVFWNTGRRVHSLGGVDNKFLEFPGYFVHGTISWNSKTQESIQIGESIPQDFVKTFEAELNTWTHAKLEIKPTALRITVPQKQFALEVKQKFAQSKIKVPSGWTWYEGPRGIELLQNDFNKGTAVHQCLLDNYSKKSVIPVAVGDDYLDKFAIEVCLKFGGYALLVGENCGWITEIPHNPKQILYFETPQDVLNLLNSLTK